MNHLKTGTAYFAQGSYKGYKYSGKELQETGMYSYGWREYMPDIGRWNGIDQLAENYLSASPYAYVVNNPISFFDPDGRVTMAAISATMTEVTPDGSNSYWYNNGNGGFTSYDGGDKGGHAGGGSLAYGSTVSYSGIFTMGDGVYTLPPLVLSGNSSGWGQQIQSQFNSYMNNLNNNWGANVAMGVTGVMSLPTGGGASAGTWTAIRGILGELAGGLRAGLWSLPLMLNGDSAHAPAYNIPLTTSVDVPVTTTDVNKNGILLYRGISADIHTETQLSMYNEALFGIAIPNGLRPGNKAHWNMDDHARGDNYSVWTSWTSDPNVARDFATNYGTAPGVVLSKRFKVGVNAIPNISPTGMSMQEKEWLIFGPVTRANVQHVKP